MAEFVCGVREKNPKYVFACEYLPEYQETGYCVLHFPGLEKKVDFEQVKKHKFELKDYDFSAAVFPEGTSDFRGFKFDADASFSGATFIGEADFSGAQFNGKTTDFSSAQFSGRTTDFREAQFSGESTDFLGAQFSGQFTGFVMAQFSGESTYFTNTLFSAESTSFSGAQFSSRRTDFSNTQVSSERTHFSNIKFVGKWTLFLRAQFSGESTYFSNTQFSGESTSFRRAQFSGESTSFSEAQFSGESTDFQEAQFSGERTNFREAQFSCERTDFRQAQFGSEETDFHEATYVKEVDFTGATFKEQVAFWGSEPDWVFGSEAWARFNRCRLEKPEQFKFQTVLLHPGWFVNADVRKVDFTDVKWYGMPGGPKGTLDEEIHALKDRSIESPHTLLAQACRRLSANAEENREYPLANEFHYWSMDALRKGHWSRLGLIGTLYWALSGYGVRAARAFWVLVAMWVAFTTLYVLVDPSEFKNFGQGVSYVWQAAVYSLLALVRLNPEPRPEDPGVFQFLVGLEGILGPLQVALLALAVRRKVMR